MRLEWHETAPGLLYEADGDGGRRYVITAAGQNWTLDLLIDGEYQTEQAVDPQPASTLDEAKRWRRSGKPRFGEPLARRSL